VRRDTGAGRVATRAALERCSAIARGPALLDVALAHPSFAHEFDGRAATTTRVPGRRRADLAVARLSRRTPHWSRRPDAHAPRSPRARGARCARELGLAYARRSTERKTGGADKERILANVFEALLRLPRRGFRR
jgi:hypothetical protein